MIVRLSIKGCFVFLFLKIYEFENCVWNWWLCVVISLYYVYSIYRINIYVLYRKCMIMWFYIFILLGVWVYLWLLDFWYCEDGDFNILCEIKLIKRIIIDYMYYLKCNVFLLVLNE